MSFLIRLANLKDKKNIQVFLDKYWKKDHILSLSDKLFDYMYKNEISKKYNFLISIDDKTNNINGLLGFIEAKHYDPFLPDSRNVLWYSLWKIIEGSDKKLLGIKLMIELRKLYPSLNQGTVGAGKEVLPIYKALGYKTGNLSTYIALNFEIEKFIIARGFSGKKFIPFEYLNKIKIFKVNKNRFSSLKTEFDNTAIRLQSYKTFNYVKSRYFDNPFLKYELWILKLGKEIGFIILRRISYKNSSLVKFVDYIGEKKLISFLGPNLCQKIMEDAEYIEFRCFGLNDELSKAGFIEIKNSSEIIIPSYHDPFVFENLPTFWTSLKFIENQIIVTGDGDQDRINTLSLLNRKNS